MKSRSLTMILGVAVLGPACGPVGGAVYRQAMSSSIKEAPEPRDDSVSGAWGMQGGPTKGFVPAGLGIGGELSPDASRGATGVYVNGRELHLLDVIALQRFTQVPQGRYWLDAQGNGGFEGEDASFNLYALAASSGGNGPGPWSYYTQAPLGASAGGDGQGFSYYIDRDTSWTSP